MGSRSQVVQSTSAAISHDTSRIRQGQTSVLLNLHQDRPRTLGVIPARLASTRLHRKVLREIAGRPMLAWVYDAARACPQLDDLLIATDSAEVEELCHA